MAVERVHGLADLLGALRDLAPSLRRRALRNGLAAGARVVRDEAKRQAPVLSAGLRRVPYRSLGTVRRAISVRTSKAARRAGNVGVFVNVRPAQAGQRGAGSRTDPFYWRWLEFGSRKMSARPFLRPATAKFGEALGLVEKEVIRWADKLNSRRP